YNDDIESLVCTLKQYRPLFVIPGFHTSVYLADELGTRLNIPSNSSHSTQLRMDKYLMHKKLEQHGINYAKSYLVDSKEKLLERFRYDLKERPVVVKPSNSAGTDSVFLCQDSDEVINAFEKIISEVNVMDIINEKVLIQEYLEGTEYIVNTVTYHAEHVVTDIWRSEKIEVNGNFVYDKTIILEAEGDIQDELSKYNNKVLDVLEFTFGACHNELVYTERGPVLIETNPRVSGGHLPEIAFECTGAGQILWIRDMIANLISGENIIKPTHYILYKKACSVCFISKHDGIVKGYRNLEKIKSLPSYHSMDIRVDIGHRIVKTVDVWTGPGMVVLIHEDPRVLEEDYKKVREFEEDLFVLEQWNLI
ncbi:MAG: ATP-grasp domain-containing protein, partial [Ruminiclostridium sp.]